MSSIALNTSKSQTILFGQIEIKKDEVFEYYDLTGEIVGKGGFGTVHKGEDRKTGSPVAIKTQARTQVARMEACALKTFNAAHLVCCREVFEDPIDHICSKVYIVMDLVPEKNIGHAFLNRTDPNRCLNLNDITCITHQVLEFLADLNRSKAVYFDLKPENLIYDRASRSLTVIDMGALRHPSFGTSLKFTTTPPYRSPEFILKQNFGSTYDCWSLACTIFRMVTDQYLFFIPSSIPFRQTNNYLLQLIVQQLGTPPAAYLDSCEKAKNFFESNMQFKSDLAVPFYQSWVTRLREAGTAKNWPSAQVDQMVDLLSQLLRYENRATAEQLLNHPLFSSETVVHLVHDRQKKGKLYIHRASTIPVTLRNLTFDHLADPDFVIDFSGPVPKCLHLPSDSEGKYVVVLERGGRGIKQWFFSRNSNELDIRQMQKELPAEDTIVTTPTVSSPFDPLEMDAPPPPPVPSAKRRLSFSSEEKATESVSFKRSKKES